jgi:hypothetical protein
MNCSSLLLLLGVAPLLATGLEVPPAIPEPSTYLMMAAGVGALAFARYRKSKKK